MISDKTLHLAAPLPETLAQGIVGSKASCIWGDPDLEAATIRKILASTSRNNSKNRLYDLDINAVSLTLSDTNPVDEQKAQEELDSGLFPWFQIEPIILTLMKSLPPSVRLHVYSALKAKDECLVDLSPWIEGADHPIIIKRDRSFITYASSGSFISSGEVRL